jgi:hypothetical protein
VSENDNGVPSDGQQEGTKKTVGGGKTSQVPERPTGDSRGNGAGNLSANDQGHLSEREGQTAEDKLGRTGGKARKQETTGSVPPEQPVNEE